MSVTIRQKKEYIAFILREMKKNQITRFEYDGFKLSRMPEKDNDIQVKEIEAYAKEEAEVSEAFRANPANVVKKKSNAFSTDEMRRYME